MKWTLSKQTLRACAIFSLCAISSLAQAATISIPNYTATQGSAPTMPVVVSIEAGAENLQGVEFAFEVVDPSGKITISSLNLEPPGGAFTNVGGNGVTTFDVEFGPTNTEVYQQLVINSSNPRTFARINGVKPLGVATLSLANAVPGTYALRAMRTTTGYVTRIADDSSDNAELDGIQYINGSLTILPVPEPSTILMAALAGLGLVVYGFRRRAAA